MPLLKAAWRDLGVILGENTTGPLRIGVCFMYLTMQRTKKANTKAETKPVKIPETMLMMMTLEVILDSSGVDDGRVVDKCFTVLRRQLALVLVLEANTKKKNKSRERVL